MDEFAEGYFKPEGITSMMDVPIRRNGRVIGLFYHRHAAPPRSWTLEEEHFAISVGDILALALEASERQRMEKINASIMEISAAANSAENIMTSYSGRFTRRSPGSSRPRMSTPPSTTAAEEHPELPLFHG